MKKMKALRVLAIMMILMAFSILQPLMFNDLNVSTAETEISGENILTQEIIDEFIQELNSFRAEEGLQPVVYNYDIQAGADIRAGETGIEFSHTRPNGEGFSSAFENPNEAIRMENIAGGYSTVSAVFQGWKDSEGHRANMLIPDLKSVVLGLNSTDEVDMSMYWVLNGSGYAEPTDENEEESEGEEEGSESEEPEEDTESEEEDAAKEDDDTAKEEDDTAKEEDDTAKEEDDTAKEEDDAAKEEDDVAKEEDDTAKEEDDVAKEEDDTAKEEDDAAKEEDDTAKEEDDAAKEEDDTAKEEDDRAKEEADRAKAEAIAKEEADAAKEAEDRAKEEADAAKEVADRAKEAEDQAKADAIAKEEADRAKEEEDLAKEAGDSAKDDADTAKATPTATPDQAKESASKEVNEEGQRLPDTASPTWNIMFAGFLLVLGCPLLLMTNRRIKKRR